MNQKIEKIIDAKKKLSESTIKKHQKVKTLRQSREKNLTNRFFMKESYLVLKKKHYICKNKINSCEIRNDNI